MMNNKKFSSYKVITPIAKELAEYRRELQMKETQKIVDMGFKIKKPIALIKIDKIITKRLRGEN